MWGNRLSPILSKTYVYIMKETHKQYSLAYATFNYNGIYFWNSGKTSIDKSRQPTTSAGLGGIDVFLELKQI